MQVAFTALGRMEAMARRPEGALEAARRTLAAGASCQAQDIHPGPASFLRRGKSCQSLRGKPLPFCPSHTLVFPNAGETGIACVQSFGRVSPQSS